MADKRDEERSSAVGGMYTTYDADGNVTSVTLPDPNNPNELITLEAEETVETTIATGEDHNPSAWEEFTAGWEFSSGKPVTKRANP